MKTFSFLLFLVLLFSCQLSWQKKTVCDKLFEAPQVQELELEDLYKEACWQLYKFNLPLTDSFVVQGTYLDSTFQETVLSEFNLELKEIRQIGDSITFVLPFEKGVVPLEEPYFYTASFWRRKEKVTIGDDLIITWDRDAGEEDFRAYIKSHSNKLSPMLHCLAIERGVLSEMSN